ncbi:hypothetical protein Rhal01_00757 [Rubritalea halochordaticola]|uniref:Uncharacterized protein n=1 Tax=Rubritalea halochordaticola TaxID=714537 RepID=A0ABP9UW01_9BACT
MTSDQQNKAELGGYICPSCRLVFSAHSSQLGEQVQCPGCKHLLIVPRKGEEEQVLYPRKSRSHTHASAAHSGGEAHQGRADRRKPDWDRDATQAHSEHSSEHHSLPWVWIVPAGVIGLGAFSALLMMIFNSSPVEPPAERDASAAAVPDYAGQQQEPEVKKVSDVYEPMEHDDLLKDSLTKFFAAESIEDLKGVVRRTKGIDERMKLYYSTRPFNKKKFKSLVSSAALLDDPSKIEYSVRLTDYTTKDGVAQMVDGKIYIDWESAVAYSEKPWKTIAAEKSTKPVLVRAISRPSSYYNLGFQDDKWSAFELTSPVEDASFVGYVPKNGVMYHRLNPIGGSGTLFVVLKIKYPEDAISTDQVIIDEIIDTKWVIEELEPQK